MKKSFHFIGIGGIGMSALARMLMQRGENVSGSDAKDSTLVRSLVAGGAKVYLGHRAEYVLPGACVVYSSDIKEDNPEYRAAQEAGCMLMHRSQMLACLMEGSVGLAVAGTHGKTTTSSLLAHVLISAQEDPSFVVGGILAPYNTNAVRGAGKYFVIEADESDGSFLAYHPHAAIITNIDTDHMAYWGSLDALQRGFTQFADQVTGPLVWCADDPHTRGFKGLSYGKAARADARIIKSRSSLFSLGFQGRTYEDIAISLMGEHNILNAAAVFTLCMVLGVEEALIREGLRTFQGVGRRLEKKGEFRGAFLYDDYAHHPTEVLATLKALRSAMPMRRILVAFQPHRYTRTQECMGLFRDAFSPADEVVITDVYAAGEEAIEGVTGRGLAALCLAEYVPRESMAQALRERLREEDVLVTMGAGDITFVAGEIICG